jgi:hypothetical protein
MRKTAGARSRDAPRSHPATSIPTWSRSFASRLSSGWRLAMGPIMSTPASQANPVLANQASGVDPGTLIQGIIGDIECDEAVVAPDVEIR